MNCMHPNTAGFGWILKHIVVDDSENGIVVAVFQRHDNSEFSLGFRWVYKGKVTHLQGREWRSPFFGANSEWVLFPHDFAAAIAKTIIEKHAVGMKIEKEGFDLMLNMMVRNESILPSIGY